MEHYKIFPDYMTSGCWLFDHTQMKATTIPSYVPPLIQITLKYWVHIWEFGNETMTHQYKIQWWYDGQEIVNELNALGIDTFEYAVSEDEL